MKINIDKLRDKVKFTFTAEGEDQSPEDHFDCRETVAEVQKAIDDEAKYSWGPVPLWFCSKVVASYNGLSGEIQYLGCCSYETYEEYTSEKQGYYHDQCEQAFDSLVEVLQDLISDLEDIID